MISLFTKLRNITDLRQKIYAYVLVAMAILDLCFGTAALLHGETIFGSVVVAMAAGFGLVFLPMQLYGYSMASRVLVPYFACALLFIPACFYGQSLNIQVSMFIGAIYPFIAFTWRERKGIYATLPVPIAFYLILEIGYYRNLDYFFGGNFHIAALDPFLNMIMILCTFAIVSAAMFIFAMQVGLYQERLALANENKDRLIRTICHDIRNPLLVSLAYVGQMNSDDPRQLKRIQAISRANEQINKIISNVAEMQGLNSGKVNINIEKSQLSKIIDDCLFVLQERLEQKTINVELDLAHDALVLVNQTILTHSVLNNIFTNAIKFSHPGSTIYVKSSLQHPKRLKLEIRDEGIGIPEAILNDLFNPAAPTTRRGTQNESGTGFGMPLAKAYLEAMGGQINVRSKTAEQDQHGTTFEVILTIV